MTIYRVKLIGDTFDFDSEESAKTFIEDDKNSGYEYTIAPITEAELVMAIAFASEEIRKDSRNETKYTVEQIEEYAKQIQWYQNALKELAESQQAKVAIPDTEDSAIGHLLAAALYLAPIGEQGDAFQDLLKQMQKAGESKKYIATVLSAVLHSGLMYGTWISEDSNYYNKNISTKGM